MSSGINEDIEGFRKVVTAILCALINIRKGKKTSVYVDCLVTFERLRAHWRSSGLDVERLLAESRLSNNGEDIEVYNSLLSGMTKHTSLQSQVSHVSKQYRQLGWIRRYGRTHRKSHDLPSHHSEAFTLSEIATVQRRLLQLIGGVVAGDSVLPKPLYKEVCQDRREGVPKSCCPPLCKGIVLCRMPSTSG